MPSLRAPLIVATLVLLAGCAAYHPRPIAPGETAAAFDMRSLTDEGLRAFLEENHVVAPSAGDAWNLKALTLVAFYYQPALGEARVQLLAAQATQVTAGQRPNPSVSVTPGFDSGIPGNFSPWLVPVSIDWPIETAGKRGYRIAQARYLSAAARWNLVGIVWQVRSRVRAALLSFYAAREAQSLLDRQKSAQSTVVRLLEGQFTAGNLSSYEVTQARVALDTTRIAWQQSVGQSHQALAQLASALGLPARALDGTRFSFAGFKRFPQQLTRPEARQRALLSRADVRGALAEYAASQSALQLEIANQYPDLHLGPGYVWNAGNAGDSEWDLGVTLTVPILNQNQGRIAEGRAKRELAAAHFLTVQAQAIGEIDSALVSYQAALQQVATAEALQENLRRQLNSARAQVQLGEAEPLTVANSEVEFLAGAQHRLNALVQTQQALGQIEDAVQSPLTLPRAALDAAEKGTVSR